MESNEIPVDEEVFEEEFFCEVEGSQPDDMQKTLITNLLKWRYLYLQSAGNTMTETVLPELGIQHYDTLFEMKEAERMLENKGGLRYAGPVLTDKGVEVHRFDRIR